MAPAENFMSYRGVSISRYFQCWWCYFTTNALL